MRVTSRVLGTVCVVVFAACSNGNSSSDGTSSTVISPTSVAPIAISPVTELEPPSGPAADLSEELTGGDKVFLATSDSSGKLPEGYVEHEYVASGMATSYSTSERTFDGRWTFVPSDSAPYRTRILVRRPQDAADFSGTVIVEWNNVSGGVDAAPDYDSLYEEITRSGDIWVGVSAQLIGVMGGPVLVRVPGPGSEQQGLGLVGINPERYGGLEHPGDGYSFDIYTQVARALRAGGAPLGGSKPERLIGAGESQSAAALVTYINGVEPLTHVFDGYFLHSRGATGLSLAEPGQAVSMADRLGASPELLRTDLNVVILNVQTESDTGLLRSLEARQPDDEHFRLWEVAGTAHADARLLGGTVAFIDCGLPVNNGPMHLVVKAAFEALDQWLQTGTPPPSAPRFEITAGDKPEISRDADGIVLGGIRTPLVDVPVDVLSGSVQPGVSVLCILSGTTKPLTDQRLTELYASRAQYLQRFNDSADRAIADGYVLAVDRPALLDYANPDRLPS